MRKKKNCNDYSMKLRKIYKDRRASYAHHPKKFFCRVGGHVGAGNDRI